MESALTARHERRVAVSVIRYFRTFLQVDHFIPERTRIRSQPTTARVPKHYLSSNPKQRDARAAQFPTNLSMAQ